MIYNTIVYGGVGLTPKKVTSLAEITNLADSSYLYLVPFISTDSIVPDYYEEYLYIDGQIEKIGSTKFDIDAFVEKPFYIHNIELFYQHCAHPYGGDGTCRASFILINNDKEPYSLSYNAAGLDYTLQEIANGATADTFIPYDKAKNYVANMPNATAWQLARLCRALAYNNDIPNDTSLNHSCSGVSCQYYPSGSTLAAHSTNYKIGVKRHNFKLSQDEYRGEQRELNKRLIVVYGFFDNKLILAKDADHESAIEISCGEYIPDTTTGIDILFNFETEDDFKAYLSDLHDGSGRSYTIDFTHQILTVEDNVSTINLLGAKATITDYATHQEMLTAKNEAIIEALERASNQDAVVLAEAQEYANSLIQ